MRQTRLKQGKKIRKYFWVMVILLSAVFMLAPMHADAFSGTINFSGTDMGETGTGDVIVDGQDGAINASDITGFNVQIYGSEDGTTPIGKFIYLDFQNVITPSDVPTYQYNYIVIESSSGSEFCLNSIYINNCNGTEDSVKVEGYRNSTPTGAVTLALDAGGNPSLFSSSNGLTPLIFQNVDKVLISSNTVSATDVTAGIGAIEIADPVVPTISLTADTTDNSVDNDLEITFTPNTAFETAITGISCNGNTLTSSQYSVSNGKVTLKPSAGDNTYLRTPGTANVVISATGYGNSSVSQTILAGAVNSLEVTTQPVPGAASGNAFATQPVVRLKDKYGNICASGVSKTANVVATATNGSGAFSISGTTTRAAVNGVATFTDLTCTPIKAGTASISFNSASITDSSSSFTLPLIAAKVLTSDNTNNTVDYDIEITFTPDSDFETAITGVSYAEEALAENQYTVTSGKLTLHPSESGTNILRQGTITADVKLYATGYAMSKVTQTILSGDLKSLEVTMQPVPGAASGDAFAAQPVVAFKDQYGNICNMGTYAFANITASPKNGTGSFNLGGTTTKSAVNGRVTFTDLTCIHVSTGNGSITFTGGGKTIDSAVFAIPLNAPKVLTADTTNNSVDSDLEITFAADASFEAAIKGVSYNGTALTANQYSISSGKVTLKPSVSDNTYLRTPGTGNVIIAAAGYGNSSVSQTILAGAVESIEIITQPVPGAASGDAFATQPVVKLKDQYGNYCTSGVSKTANVVATAKSGTGTFSIGGTTTKAAVNGTATFTDLTCTLTTVGTGRVSFTSGVKAVDSTSFTIPQNAAKALTADTTDNSVDNELDITFATDSSFEAAITGVSYNGTALTANQYSISSGKVTLKPSVSDNTYLRTPGTGNVIITATGYVNSIVSQTILAGAVESIEIITQPVPGEASGDAFATQPVVKLKDQYGNYCTTGVSRTANVVAAAKSGTGTFSIGGTTTKAAVDGTATFTDLTCTLTTVGTGSVSFTSGVKEVDSTSFTIPQNVAKALTADTTDNSVDNELEITFAADASFEAAITGVSYNGTALTANQYSISSGKVTLKPSVSDNTYLRTPGTGNVIITATGYGNSTVSQTILAGAVESIEVITQPVPGAASGDTFTTQPVVKLKDQYGNYCTTGVSKTANVIAAAKSGTGTFSIGGTTTKAAVDGTATFTDLTCTLTTVGTGSISFASGVKAVDSTSFTIPQNVAKVLTADTTDNSVDNELDITFAADASFEAAITGVSYNGNTLTSSQYSVSSGKVTLKPSVSDNTYLRTPGTGNVIITAAGYGNSTVSQTITHGTLRSMAVAQNITAPAANGGRFVNQPIINLMDQYGNLCTSDNSTQVTASKKDTGVWTLTGTLSVTANAGRVVFTDLGSTNAAAVSNAQLAFDANLLPQVVSTTVVLPGVPQTPNNNSSASNGSKTESFVTSVVIVNEKEQTAGSQATEDGSTVIKVSVNNGSDEIKAGVLTPQEQEVVARGENAKIILKVSDISNSVSDQEKKLINEQLISENTAANPSILYVDLSMFKQIGNQEQTRVTQTNHKINISIEVPEKFWNTDIAGNRDFYVIRIHDNEVTRIDGTYDPKTHLFTFETDRFSTYALTYQDSNNQDSNNQDSNNQDSSNIVTYQDFWHLQLKVKANKTSQILTYRKAVGVDGYLIYGAKCGEKMKELADVPADTVSYKVMNLKKGTYYKYQIKAYRIIDGERVIVMTSKVVHSITEHKTYANPIKVTPIDASVKLVVGKSKMLSCQVVLQKGKKLKQHTAVVRYETSDKSVATVNSKGKITAKAKGNCYLYAYAQNGVYQKSKITVE